MHKNKYKKLYYSRVMRDLRYVGKQRNEIKKCRVYAKPNTVREISFHYISLQIIHENHATRVFLKKTNSDLYVKFNLNTIIWGIKGRR
jgi:hypothetical protein